ncbi:unnamed protein product [Colias eurytheme]|nr:unnamed protein product [Colias eurytheme]
MSENFSTIDVTKNIERKGSKASENFDSEQQRGHNYGTRNKKKRTVEEAAVSVISERLEISEVQYFPDKLLQLYKKPLSISVAKKRFAAIMQQRCHTRGVPSLVQQFE